MQGGEAGWWRIPVRAGIVAVWALLLPVSPAADEAVGVLPPLVERALSDDYQIRAWHRSEGLPAERVTTLVAGRDGSLWIGTPVGFARFDGLRFVRFDRANTPALGVSSVLQLAEDGRGDLAIATADNRVVVWTSEGWFAPGLEGRGAQLNYWMRSSSAGRIWLNSRTGLVCSGDRIPGGPGAGIPRWERPSMPLDFVTAVDETPEGERCWVGAERVLLLGTDGKTLADHALPARGDRSLAGAAVEAEPDGSFWYLHGHYAEAVPWRLGRVSTNGFRLLDDDVPGTAPPAFLHADGQGGVWYHGGSGRVARTTERSRTRYRLPGGAADDRVLAITGTSDGSVWIGLELGGLLQLKPRQVREVGKSEGLPHVSVRCVLRAEAGVLVAGTDDGVASLSTISAGGEFRPQASCIGLEGRSVRVLARDAEGILWAGTSRGLFARRGGQWEQQSLPRLPLGASDSDGLGSAKIRDLVVTRSGDLWVAAAHQLVVLRPDELAPRLVAALSETPPTCLLEDRAGNLWLGLEKAGLVVYGAGIVARSEALPGFDESANRTEVNHWHVAPTARLEVGDGLASDHVWQLHHDAEGRLWILCDRGVQRFPAAAVRRLAGGHPLSAAPEERPFLFTTHHGLPELAPNSFVDDGAGNLWLGGDQGVARIPLADFDRVAAGTQERLTPEVFTEIDGLPAKETNGRVSHPGAAVDEQGRVWFGTTGGLAAITPRAATPDAPPPPTVIEEVRADGHLLASTFPTDPAGGRVIDSRASEEGATALLARHPRRCVQSGPEPVRLPPGRGRVLEFRFAGFDFADPANTRFRYQLVGYDTEPNEAGTRREAYYTNLSPGTYRFRVWAARRTGPWSREPAEFVFTLVPFLWQTLGFRVASVGGAVALVALGVTWRIRQVRRIERLRRRAEQAELRTRLARDLHDGVGSGLARLALLAHAPPDAAETSGPAARQFRELSAAVRELADTVREVSWNASPEPLALEALMARVAQRANEYLGAAGIRCRTSLPVEFPEVVLPPEQRSSLYFALKEAIANLLRHSGATEASFEVALSDATLLITLADNGRGFAAPESGARASEAGEANALPRSGNGLPNLRARIAALGGELRFESRPGQGTRVVFRIPLRNLGGSGLIE